jgi:CRP/FNR family cyclic AMP-dependent transcriptional regulator
MSTPALAQDRCRPSLASTIQSAVRSLGLRPRSVRLHKGAVISLSERRSAGLYLVQEGSVKVVRLSDDGKALLLELAGGDEIFGEMTLFGEMSEDATYAEALEATDIEVINRLALSRLLAASPQLALRLTELIGAKRIEVERRLESHVLRKVPYRLANELLRLAARYGTLEAAGAELRLRLSQQDLGSLIGASREMVSLTLAEFRRRGLVSARGRRLVVRVAPLTARLADGSL